MLSRSMLIVIFLELFYGAFREMKHGFSVRPARIIYGKAFLAMKSTPVRGVCLIDQHFQFSALLAARHDREIYITQLGQLKSPRWTMPATKPEQSLLLPHR